MLFVPSIGGISRHWVQDTKDEDLARFRALPANINFRHGDAGLDLNIVANSAQTGTVRTVLSNSFGFGGTNASIIMRSVAA